MNFLSFICVVLVIVPGWCGVFLLGQWLSQKYDKYEEAMIYIMIHKPATSHYSPADSTPPMGFNTMVSCAEYLVDFVKKRQQSV